MTLDCNKIWLQKGNENADVQEMQTLLQSLGYYTGYQLDGKFGPATDDAVRAFQKRQGIKQDGKFGKVTCNKLKTITDTIQKAKGNNENVFDCSKTDLKKDQKSNDMGKVAVLQQYLQDWGYYGKQYKVDGVYGDKTYEAVWAFQQANKPLSPDGWFGKKTCEVFVKRVKTEKQDDKETHKRYADDFWKLPPGERIFYPVIHVLPEKVEITEEEIETVEQAEPQTTSTIDEETGEEIESTEETEPQVTKTTVKRVNIVSLKAEDKVETKGLDCSNIRLANGSQGLEVYALQSLLSMLGYYKNSKDGIFGPKTEAAVRAFQSANGLEDDGIVGPKTCPVLNQKGGAGGEKNKLTMKDVYPIWPGDIVSITFNSDNEALTEEMTIRIRYTPDILKHIQRMQTIMLWMFDKAAYDKVKGGFDIFVNDIHKVLELNVYQVHTAYIEEITLVQENNLMMYELTTANGIVFLEQELVDYSGTKKQTQHLKDICKELGVRLNLDVGDLPDEDFEVNPVNTIEAGGSGSGGHSVNVSGNDCNAGDKYESDHWADHRCKPPRCTVKSKEIHGNSSRSYARDTASHNSSSRELVEYVQSRCQYQYYGDNPHGASKCPEAMWNSSGKIRGNCADFARMLKCILDVNGYHSIICHIPGHFYNAIWENGQWTVCDLCRVLYDDSAYGHANHGNIKPEGTWDNPLARKWIG